MIHFAGLKAVGESVEMPLEYYENNLGSTFSLRARDAAPRGATSSSSPRSATVYGDRARGRSPRTARPSATNPYGWTKVMQEQILRDVAAADPTCGSRCCATSTRSAPTPRGTIGEDPQGIPNNLVPFIAQVAVGRREKLQVFGDDYPTAGRHRRCATTSTSRTSPPATSPR